MDSVTIIPYKMVFGGDCLAKIDGKCVFISGAIPSEQVEIEITDSKKDFYKAKVVRTVAPSKFRRNPPCEYFQRCGGCSLQYIDDEYQKELRTGILRDCFERAFYKTNVALPKIEYIGGKSFGYRNRFQFENGGLKRENSTEVVQIALCPVACDEVQQFITENFGSNGGKIQVFGSKDLAGEKKCVSAKLGKRDVVEAKININGREISFDAGSFFQSNIEVLSKAIPVLVEGLRGNTLLDMYAGVGTLSAFASENFAEVYVVEQNKKSLKYARQNVPNSKSFNMTGENFVRFAEKNNLSFDAVIIDPPRSGIEKPVREYLAKTKPPVVRAMSCDPATHARDVRYLVDSGYSLKKLVFCDFYPQTSHIESLAFLEAEP